MAVVLAVNPFVVLLAKPDHVKRAAIVIMVRLYCRINSANFAWHSNKFATLYGVINFFVR